MGDKMSNMSSAEIDSSSPAVLAGRVVDSESLTRIVTAARTCFREQGVAKTRMGQIAERAGMARQTLYDFVSGRAEIVDLAIEVRLAELAERITTTRLPVRRDLGERFVDLFCLVVDIVGNDEEYGQLAGSLGEAHAFQFLAGPSALTAVAERAFAPLFDEARRQNRFRDDVPERLIVEWLQSMLATLAARDDLEPGHVRTLLRSFALPAVLEHNR
jgi:AcrR family transcriptional regulator